MRIRLIKILAKFNLGRKLIKKHLLTEEEKTKLIMLSIRKNFYFMGYDLSNCSDEDIINNERNLHNYMNKTKLTLSQLSENLKNNLPNAS